MVALTQSAARNAAAAASGKGGFGKTVLTSAQGAADPRTAKTELTPAPVTPKSMFGG